MIVVCPAEINGRSFYTVFLAMQLWWKLMIKIGRLSFYSDIYNLNVIFFVISRFLSKYENVYEVSENEKNVT